MRFLFSALVICLNAFSAPNPFTGYAPQWTPPTYTYTNLTTLFPDATGYTDQRLGSCVALSRDANYAVGGAQYTKYGASQTNGNAYLYGRTGNTWSQLTSWQATAPANVSRYGWACSMDGTGIRLVVSQPGGNPATGAVEIYTRSGNSVALEQKITGGLEYGASVAISKDGTYLVVGETDSTCTNAVTFCGSMYIYSRSGTTWTLEQKIENPLMTNTRFGVGVTISDDNNYIGATNSSTHYIFKKTATWAPEFSVAMGLSNSGAGLPGHQGIKFSANTLSAVLGNGTSLRLYTRSGAIWTLQSNIAVCASSVAISDDASLVYAGCYNAANAATSSGALRVYTNIYNTLTYNSQIPCSGSCAINTSFGEGLSVDSAGLWIGIGAVQQAAGSTGYIKFQTRN